MIRPASEQFFTPAQLYEKAHKLGRASDRARYIAGASAAAAVSASVLFTISTVSGERPDLERPSPAEIALYGSIGLWGVTFAGGLKAERQRKLSQDLAAQALELNEEAYKHFMIPEGVVQEALLPPQPAEQQFLPEEPQATTLLQQATDPA